MENRATVDRHNVKGEQQELPSKVIMRKHQCHHLMFPQRTTQDHEYLSSWTVDLVRLQWTEVRNAKAGCSDVLVGMDDVSIIGCMRDDDGLCMNKCNGVMKAGSRDLGRGGFVHP